MTISLLVVEEDDQFRSSLSAWLRRRGYAVLEADGQEQALGILDGEAVDVLLLGCHTGEGQEWILLDQTKQMPVPPPVILLVPTGLVHLSIEGMKRGAFDDLFVPFDGKTLEERIQEAFKAKEALRKRRRSLRQRWEHSMIAATFAEAGLPDVARNIMETQGNRASSKPSSKRSGHGRKRRWRAKDANRDGGAPQ